MSELPEDLERALRELEARAAVRAERVDATRVAARVLARLRAEPVAARGARVLPLRWTRDDAPRWVGVAAAALIVVAAGMLTTGILRRPPGGEVALPVVAQGYDSLDVGALETLLQATAGVRPVASEPSSKSAGAWDDLSEEQLRAVLQAVQRNESRAL